MGIIGSGTFGGGTFADEGGSSMTAVVVRGVLATAAILAPTGVLSTHGGATVAGPTAGVTATGAAGQATHLRPGQVAVDGVSALLSLNARAGSVIGRPITRVLGQTATATLSAVAGDLDVWAVDRSGNVLTLTVYDPVVASQPGLLRISIGNGPANSAVTIFVDGVAVSTATLDATGAARALYIPIDGLAAGTHDASIATTATPPDTGVLFTTSTDATSITAQLPVPPVVLPPTTYWTFQDYYRNDFGIIETYTLPRNPESVEQNYGQNSVTSAPTAEGGTIVSWEGEPQPPSWTISGRVWTDLEHDAMVSWGQRNRRVYITDHHGDRFLVVMTGIRTERVRDPARHWHHQYTLTFTALEGPGL